MPVDTSARAFYTPARRPDGGIGRRASFRCWYSKGCGGSSPLLGTIPLTKHLFWFEKPRLAGVFSFPGFLLCAVAKAAILPQRKRPEFATGDVDVPAPEGSPTCAAVAPFPTAWRLPGEECRQPASNPAGHRILRSVSGSLLSVCPLQQRILCEEQPRWLKRVAS